MMTSKETEIYNMLQNHPGEVYITAEGWELYALSDGGMFCIYLPKNWKTLSEDEVNLELQEALKQLV